MIVVARLRAARCGAYPRRAIACPRSDPRAASTRTQLCFDKRKQSDTLRLVWSQHGGHNRSQRLAPACSTVELSMANACIPWFIREYTAAPLRRARPADNGHPRTPRISSRVGVSICTFQLSSCVSVRLSVGNQMTTFAKPKGNHCPYVLPHTHSNAETTRSRLADLAVHSRRRRVVCVSSVSSGVARWHTLLRSLRAF